MADDTFNFDTRQEVQQVQNLDLALSKLDRTVDKLDKADLDNLRGQFAKLESSQNSTVTALAASAKNTIKLLDDLRAQAAKGGTYPGLNAKAANEVGVFRAQLQTVIATLEQLERTSRNANLLGNIKKQAADAKRLAEELRTPFTELRSLMTKGPDMNMPDRRTLLDGRAKQELADGRAELAQVAALRKQGEDLYSTIVKSRGGAQSNLQGLYESLSRTRKGFRTETEGIVNDLSSLHRKLETDAGRMDRAWKRIANTEAVSQSFRSLRSSIETEGAAAAQALRSHYAEMERVSNLKTAINSRLAGATTLSSTAPDTKAMSRVDLEDAKYTQNMSGMRAFYEAQASSAKTSANSLLNLTAASGAMRSQLANAMVSAKESGVAFSELSSGVTRNIPTMGGLAKTFQNITKESNNSHSAVRGLAAGFGQLWLAWGQLGPMLAGASIGYGVSKTFSIGSEIEYNIKFMEMLGQTTASQGKIVRQELREIDQTTMFTQIELSKAMIQLGQDGFTAKESLITLRPAADLAAMGMVNLDTSTKLIVQTNNLFNRSAKDAALTAAQLFQITKSSVLNVEDLAGSMKYASEVNTRFGASLEETLALLGALAKGGIKGSSGGTALINFFRDVYGRSGPAIKALKQLENASKTTIRTFDELGNRRSGIDIFEDISKAAAKLEKIDSDKILGKLFSARGGRTYFAGFREGVDELRKQVGELEKTDPKVLFDAARGMMDTTKGAMDMLKGSLVSALDTVFENNSDRFKSFIRSVNEAIDSPEFLLGVQTIVNGVLSIYETLKAAAPAVQAFAFAWAGMKVLGLGVTIFQSMGAALAGLPAAFAALTGAVTGNTASLAANGAAMIGNAAASRATALGADAAGVATARAAAIARASTGAMRGLAIATAFLQNPFVGLAVTAAIVGTAFWASSQDVGGATESMTKSIIDTGRVNMDQWSKEIAMLRDRNALLGKKTDTFSSGDAAVAAAELKMVQMRHQRETLRGNLSKLEGQAEPDMRGVTSQRGVMQVQADRTKLKADRTAAREAINESIRAESELNNNINTMKGDLNKSRTDERNRLDDEERAARKKYERLNPPQGDMPLVPTAGGGAGDFKREPKFVVPSSNLMSTLEAQMTQRETTLKRAYDGENKLLEARYKAGLTLEADYQAQSLASTLAYEAKLSEERRTGMDGLQSAYIQERVKLQDVLAKAVAAKAENGITEITSKIENLDNNWDKAMSGFDEKSLQTRTDATLRFNTSLIAVQGSVVKMRETMRDYMRDVGANWETQGMGDQLEAKWLRNPAGSMRQDAQKASEIASLNEYSRHQSKIEELRQSYTQTNEELKKMQATELDSIANTEEWTAKIQALKDAAKSKGFILDESTAAVDRLTNEAGKRAFQLSENQAKANLATGISEAVITGLKSGGSAGAKALRDLIQQEFLLRPLQAMISGTMASAMGVGSYSAPSWGSILGNIFTSTAGSLIGSGGGLKASAPTSSVSPTGVADYGLSSGSTGLGLKPKSSFDVGTPYVSHDQVAKIHRGERIMTASENASYAGNSGGSQKSVVYSPTFQVNVDSRSDKQSIQKDINQALRSYDKVQKEQMRQMGIIND